MTPEAARDARCTGAGWDRLIASAVSPGVWATTIPFPSPLSYSYSYSVRTSQGLVVVDLGWDSDDNWTRFQRGLARSGASLQDVVGVVITHVHPDHYGLAPRIKEQTGAWIAAHPAERPLLTLTTATRQQRVAEMERWLEGCGTPVTELDALRAESAQVMSNMPRVDIDIDLLDGDLVPGTDGALVAMHTPGHTPGHLCLQDRERGLVFTGDHLLPRVTPNVPRRPRNGDDPLGDYEASLERLVGLGRPHLVLPGHEWPFDHPEARVRDLKAHHVARLEEVEAAVRDGAETVWEVAIAVPWSRPFARLDTRARRQALGETNSHLHALSRGGRLTFIDGVPERWSVI